MSIWGKLVSFSGGGGSSEGSGNIKGFEVYAADNKGGTRNNTGKMPNGYFVCFFHDNMSDDYKLNGTTYSYPIAMNGNGIAKIKAETKVVSDNINRGVDAELDKGSAFETTHNDSGSYISVVGGWVGYKSGGTVYKNAVTGTVNSITLNRAHETLLVFVGGSAQGLSQNTIDINGNTYTIANIGAMYDNVYGVYGAIEIDNNSDTVIEVTFPSSCYNFVSIIGINGSEGSGNIDLSYLPNSDSSKVVASADYTMLEEDMMGNFTHFKNTAGIEGQSATPLQMGTDYIICPANEGLFVRVVNANTDCTVYGVTRRTGTSSGEHIYIGVPYSASRQNAPSYWVPNTSIRANVYDVAASAISGKSNRDFHVLAISIDNTNKKARFFCDGVFDTELSFSNSGACLTIGSFMVSQSGLSPDITHVQYAGAVSELESDATIIANMQTIMQKLGITG